MTDTTSTGTDAGRQRYHQRHPTSASADQAERATSALERGRERYRDRHPDHDPEGPE